MQTYGTENLRNVALVGHTKSGKTSLAEAMLLASGALTRAGRVEDGNTVSDSDEQEHQHGYSIFTSLITVEWRGHRINLLDTPGYADFEGEVVSAATVADTAVIALDGAAGIESGTEAAWEHIEACRVPARMFAVMRLDREHADFARVVDALRSRYGDHVAALAIPDAGLTQVVSLLSPAAPTGMEEEFAAAREQLLEAVAESDDTLLEHYLEGESIGDLELAAAVRAGIANGGLLPVVPVAATAMFGVEALLDTLVELTPAPQSRVELRTETGSVGVGSDGPPVAQVFKTVSDPFVGHLSLVRVLSGRLARGEHLKNWGREYEERAAHLFVLRGHEQIEMAELPLGDIGAIPKLMHTVTGDLLVTPGMERVECSPIAYPEPQYRSAILLQRRDDMDKLTQAMARLQEQDPTVRIVRDPETAETVLYTQGEVQAGIIGARLQREYGVAVDLDEPQVPFRETVRQSARADYRHKKQTGGRGQFGHLVIEVEPLPRAAGFEFAEKVVGGSVPKQYIPAVEQGIREALLSGPLTGAPLVDLRVTLLDGSSHSVDSSEMAFKLAAEQALYEAVMQADLVLLEPVMRIHVRVPSELMGDISGLLTSSRGHIVGFEPRGEFTIVEALAPLAEVQRLSPQVRSLTHGRGRFSMTFDHHAEAPSTVQERVVANHKHGRSAAAAR